jgi:hypothetical protein
LNFNTVCCGALSVGIGDRFSDVFAHKFSSA